MSKIFSTQPVLALSDIVHIGLSTGIVRCRAASKGPARVYPESHLEARKDHPYLRGI